MVISYENDSLKSSFPPWRCYTSIMWLHCPQHWSYTGHRYSQLPSSQVWPSLRSVWQSLTPLVYMFSWRAFPASDIMLHRKTLVRRVSVTCHISIQDQDSRSMERQDTLLWHTVPFQPPGSVTPGPGPAQECSRCSQPHLLYFSARTKSELCAAHWQSNGALYYLSTSIKKIIYLHRFKELW